MALGNPRHIQLGDDTHPPVTLNFNQLGDMRPLAERLYDALYETTERGPVTATQYREQLFGNGNAPAFSPFISNYVKAKAGTENITWPVGVLLPSEADYKARRTQLNDNVNQSTINVHQRGFAFTSGDALKPWLTTQSMSPCITIIVWNPARRTAGLAHVDKEQGFKATVDQLFDHVTGSQAEPVRVYFHGGNCYDKISVADPVTGEKRYVSWNTATELLKAILERPDTDKIRIVAFDVLARPHGNSLSFNTNDGMVFPEIGELAGFELDTMYRYVKVLPGALNVYPENFYADNQEPGNDPMAQMRAFNTRTAAIDMNLLTVARLQTDLRTVDTSAAPVQPVVPVIRFLNDTKTLLFNWAALHTQTLAPKAKKDAYSYIELFNLLLEAVGIGPAENVAQLEQAQAMFNRLARFEKVVRRGPKVVEQATFLSYLKTLAKGMEDGKSMNKLRDISRDWIAQYGM